MDGTLNIMVSIKIENARDEDDLRETAIALTKDMIAKGGSHAYYDGSEAEVTDFKVAKTLDGRAFAEAVGALPIARDYLRLQGFTGNDVQAAYEILFGDVGPATSGMSFTLIP